MHRSPEQRRRRTGGKRSAYKSNRVIIDSYYKQANTTEKRAVGSSCFKNNKIIGCQGLNSVCFHRLSGLISRLHGSVTELSDRKCTVFCTTTDLQQRRFKSYLRTTMAQEGRKD